MSLRRLSDLKVVDLRNELAKRGADKSGVKPTLMERLREIILKEGRDPSTYDFNKPDEVQSSVANEDLVVKLENLGDDALTDTNGNAEKSESHLTAVSEGSIGVPESSENEDKVKREPVDQLEDATTFVVGVGETEDDLDYDIEEAPGPSGKGQMQGNQEQKDTAEKLADSVIKSQREQPEKAVDKSPAKITLTFLLVSNLKLTTKAVDLKQHFSAYGKVISGKIMASRRTPGGCVGFLTLATPEDAAMCIKKLDGTEFNGRIIKVEKTSEIPTAPQKVTMASEKSHIVSNQTSSKPRRHHGGSVGKRAISSSRHAKTADAKPTSTREHPSSREIRVHRSYKRDKTLSMARSQLKRTLRKAHDIANSKTADYRILPRKRRRESEPENRVSNMERPRPKAPRTRDPYYENQKSIKLRESSRVRYDIQVDRKSAHYESRSYTDKELRVAYPSRILPRDESLDSSLYYTNSYNRHGPRYSPLHPVELSPRQYSKPPVVYRRQPAIIPARYPLDGRRMERQRYDSIDNSYDPAYFDSSRNFDTTYKDRFQPHVETRYRPYETFSRSREDDPISSSRRSDGRDLSWRTQSSSRRRSDLETSKRPRSPVRHRTHDLNQPRSPPIRYARRLSPVASSSGSQRNRSDYPPSQQLPASSSSYIYPRRSGGGGGDRSSYSNMTPSISGIIPSRRAEKVIDYGHKPSSSTKYNWETQQRSRGGYKSIEFPTGFGVSEEAFSPTRWGSSGNTPRQQPQPRY